MRRGLTLGVRAAVLLAQRDDATRSSDRSTWRRSRSSSRPACSSKTTRRSTSSATAAARSTARTHIVQDPAAYRRGGHRLGARTVVPHFARNPENDCHARLRVGSASSTSPRGSSTTTPGPASTASRPRRTSATSPVWSTRWTRSSTTTRRSPPWTARRRPTCCTASRRRCSTPASRSAARRSTPGSCDKCVELAAIAAGGIDELRERPFIGFGTCASARSSCPATPPT